MYPDPQSPKLDFSVDSRLRGHNVRFCKGLIKGEGIGGCVGLLYAPRHNLPLWIDESWMMFFEHLGFHP